MKSNDVLQVYVSELQELRSVEEQLVAALPKMAQAAQHPELKQAFEQHLEETRSHQQQVETILRRLDAEPREHVDQAMQAIIREAEKMMQMTGDPDLRDAEMIGSAQRVEHYEIAAYGTLATYAKCLGHDDDARALHAILDQEKKADALLTQIAERIVNPEALAV
jgi:ferritin-like metal-binding protein YciE